MNSRLLVLVAALLVLALVIAAWLTNDRGAGAGVEPGVDVTTRAETRRGELVGVADLGASVEEAGSSGRARAAASDVGNSTSRVAPDSEPIQIARIDVVVASSESGVPLAGLEVRVETHAAKGDEPPSGAQLRSRVRVPASGAKTDAEGRVEIRVPAGADLHVFTPAMGNKSSGASARITAPAAGRSLEVRLTPRTLEDATIEGLVLRSDTLQPIAGARVATVPLEMFDVVPETTSANDGSFRLAIRSYATQGLHVTHGAFGGRRMPYPTGLDSPLVVTLTPGASIRASVIDAAGAPTEWWTLVARGAEGSAHGERGRGDEVQAYVRDGVAVLTSVDAGRSLEVELLSGTRVAWRSDGPIVLAPGEVRALAIRCGASSLQGRVTDADGTLLRGVEVFVESVARERSSAPRDSTRTDPAGRYEFPRLEPGAWILGARTAVTNRTAPAVPASFLAAIELPPGGMQYDVVIAPRRLEGRVIDATGGPVADAEVEARHRTLARAFTASSGPDGGFLMDVPLDGTWTLRAATRDRRASPSVEAAAGDAAVLLRIAQWASLVVRASDSTGREPEDLVVAVMRDPGEGLVPPARGSPARFERLAAGRVHVVVRARDRYGIARDVELEPGAERGIVVDLAPAGCARLRYEGPAATASVVVLDRGVEISRATLQRGSVLDLTGPEARVEVRVRVGSSEHSRSVELGAGAGPEIVFDSGWR